MKAAHPQRRADDSRARDLAAQFFCDYPAWRTLAQEMPEEDAGAIRFGFRDPDGAVPDGYTSETTAAVLRRAVSMYGLESFPNLVWTESHA